MIDVRRAGTRFHTAAAGIDSWHSFSYGPHYDPDNLGFGVLLVNNEDRLAPGAGFARHPHRDVDIVTWMIAGTLEHEDSTGHRQVLTPGMAQQLRTGSGVQHAEHAPADSTGAHYVQMWVRSTGSSNRAHYAFADLAGALDEAGRDPAPALIPVASGAALTDGGDAAPLRLDQPAAELAVTRLAAGRSVQLPSAPLVHVFVTAGALRWDGPSAPVTPLAAGDALRLTGPEPSRLSAEQPSEILVWQLG